MNTMNNEELDAWLEEVEQASAEIKALVKDDADSETIKQVDKQIARRQARKLKEQQDKDRKDREAFEKRKKGRFGKGEKDNYTDFCKFCFREYDMPTPICLQCGKETQPREERKKYLMGKVQDYKDNKTRRAERKTKWELWKKTQAMVWKKTQTDYSKWDYYTSESDSEEEKTDPIVPEDDPQFKAMEADLEKRNKDRKEKRAKAEECKKKGNDYMAKEDYEKAVLWYSEGLDLIKDYKPLYTNRALAWIKMGYYKKAIKDCTSIIDFCECFEDGFQKSKDFAFKAFIRRALARKERKELRQAQEDINESLKLISNDKYAIQLKEEIEFLIQHNEKAQQILKDKNKIEKKTQDLENKEKEKKQEQEQEEVEEEEIPAQQEQQGKQQEETQKQEEKQQGTEMEDALNEAENVQAVYMKIIDLFLKKKDEEIQEMELELLRYMFMNTTEESKIYFYENKGIQKLISLLQKDSSKNVYLLLDIILRGNILYMTVFNKQEGVKLLYEKIEQFLEKKQYDPIEDIFEVLISMSAQDKIRDILKDSPLTLKLVENCYKKIMLLYKNEVPMVANFLKYLGNMLYQQSRVKDQIIKSLSFYLNYMYQLFQLDKKKSKFELVREQGYTVLANLLVENQVRDTFSQGKFNELIQQILMRISSYDLVQQPKYLEAAKAALSFMVNLSFRANQDTKAIMNKHKVGEILFNRFNKLDYREEKYKDLFFRLLQVLASLEVNDPESPLLEKKVYIYILKFFDDYSIKQGFCNHAIRLLATIFGTKSNEIYLAKNVEDSYYELLSYNLKKLINQEDELRFCNACTLSGFLSIFKPAVVNPKYNETIDRLLKVCTDYTGNMRKSSAHLLGKIARYPPNLEKLRNNHGIEILHSILNQVV